MHSMRTPTILRISRTWRSFVGEAQRKGGCIIGGRGAWERGKDGDLDFQVPAYPHSLLTHSSQPYIQYSTVSTLPSIYLSIYLPTLFPNKPKL